MENSRPKILIVDDEPDMRGIIDDVLTEAGYETFLAENGTHAMELAAAVVPDLILSDIQMPAMNGYEFLNAVKVHPDLSKIPFVFMTGVNVGTFDLRKGMDLGADDYLTKPFTVENLLNAVATRLRKQQLWRSFADTKLTRTQTGFIVLLSNELHLLVMDILEHAQSLLAGKDVARADVERAAQMITRSGKRLGRLHENILYYSMLQIWVKDPQTIASMRSEVTPSCREIVQSIVYENIRAKTRAEDLTVDCSDVPLRIAAPDFGKLIDEVLDNACKFSDAGTPVGITGRVEGDRYRLVIQDHGRGITEVEVAAAGSLFRQDRTAPVRTDGGVGLTIAATLAELYNGTLTAQRGPRSGTIVTIMLPVHG
ncbi:MAG: hybrid sensor histidine kinase/response regulator [Bacteroidetes bacterium]|nr:hybrid sensor histidine kinase/response regulator [Bacteroidota bacterium]